ncbi:hypothetical protein SeKA_B0001 (plasmid) [Salmonella enterica subsp. enterica serovar Kentucky str. CVM29188]|nr:hypothetical protein SeKA_B0001 [Salmonella enterica subsp. enterica serovar Kentucky str. CVM29188]
MELLVIFLRNFALCFWNEMHFLAVTYIGLLYILLQLSVNKFP